MNWGLWELPLAIAHGSSLQLLPCRQRSMGRPHQDGFWPTPFLPKSQSHPLKRQCRCDAHISTGGWLRCGSTAPFHLRNARDYSPQFLLPSLCALSSPTLKIQTVFLVLELSSQFLLTSPYRGAGSSLANSIARRLSAWTRPEALFSLVQDRFRKAHRHELQRSRSA